jgi:hypothetical protein
MTRHISRDTALKTALGMLSPQAEQKVRDHATECETCTGLIEDAERTIRVIENVYPNATAPLPPLPSRQVSRYNWLRLAAILLVGFGLGFLASESLRSPNLTVVRQQFVPAPPESAVADFVSCDAIDVSRSMR